MIRNEIKNPFVIYNQLLHQDRFVNNRSSSDYWYQLITPRDTTLPFQFIHAGTGKDIESWLIRNSDGTEAYNLLDEVAKVSMIETAQNGTYYIYAAQKLTVGGSVLAMETGFYYMEIVVGGVHYFSEVFFVPCNPFSITDEEVSYTKFEYDNSSCDVGKILYQTGYKNILYLETTLYGQLPGIEEEGEEDAFKNFIPTFQKYVDNFKIQDLLPFYLMDAMMLMSIHKDVTVRLKNNRYSGKISNIKINSTENDTVPLYDTTVTFQQDTLYVNGACCSNMELKQVFVNGETMDGRYTFLVIPGDSPGSLLIRFNGFIKSTHIRIVAENLTVPGCSKNFTYILPYTPSTPGGNYSHGRVYPAGNWRFTFTPFYVEGGTEIAGQTKIDNYLIPASVITC